MHLSALLARLDSEDPNERGSVADPLFQFLVCGHINDAEKKAISKSLVKLLQDPDILPRYRLAEALASHENAPHHLVVGLARDQKEVATPVILHSPVLSDYDLMALIQEGDPQICQIVAGRKNISPTIISALMKETDAGSCLLLLQNRTIHLSEGELSLIAERYVDNPVVHRALLNNPDLPLSIRQKLLTVLCDALIDECACSDDHRPVSIPSHHVIRRTWERIILEISDIMNQSDRDILAAHLRDTGKITTSLLFRSLVFGQFPFFESSLACLSGVPVSRVRQLLADYEGLGLRILYLRAGLPAAAYCGFVTTLRRVLHSIKCENDLMTASIRQDFLENLIREYAPQTSVAADPVLATLVYLCDEAVIESSEEFSEDDRTHIAA